MALFGIRSKLKSMVKQALNIEPEDVAVSNPISPSATSFEPEPVPQDVNAAAEEAPIADEIQTEAVAEPEDVAPPLEEPS
ncbi:MAG: hypothetical protein VX278_12805, partial [Myxococcota bacterium]|nr:hypothetical protein [Myxococcota bacterium]